MDLSNKNSKGVTLSLPMIILAGIAIIIGGFIIGTATPAVLPLQASSEAEQIDNLFQVLLTIGGSVFLLVQGMLVYSVIRFRARPGDTSDGPNIHGNVTLEIVWTSIPAIIVLGLTLYSWQVWIDIQSQKENETVINVLAQRYNWTFSYADPLNRLEEADSQTFNSSILHTYVGQPVLLKIDAADVIHSFWVPVMRIKQDALVGRTTEVRFTPTRAGRYRVVCAELCGGGHGGMYTFIVVHENEEDYYSQFVDVQVSQILNPPDDPVEKGRNLLVSNVYACSGCHRLDDLGWVGVTGPTLNGIGNRALTRSQNAGIGSAEEYIAQSIRHPNASIAPGFISNVMPQFGNTVETPAQVDGASYVYMSNDDLTSIIAYLCTQTESGDAADTACGSAETILEAVETQSQ